MRKGTIEEARTHYCWLCKSEAQEPCRSRRNGAAMRTVHDSRRTQLKRCPRCQQWNRMQGLCQVCAREGARAALRRHRQRLREERPEVIDAYRAMNRALARGELVRPEICQQCQRKPFGGAKVHAHHHKGYAPKRALDVQWLCSTCHGAQHRGDPRRKAQRRARAR